jgi:tetratricopeptide (TPR) repeat protein
VRCASLCVVLAICFSANLSGATFVERQPIQEVELAQLIEHAQSYLNMRVKFRCIFVENGDLYDPVHTRFTDERFINIAIWDDEARLWDPQVRSQPVVTCYLDKVRAGKSCWNDLRKFQIIEIVAEVNSTFRDVPWINIHTIEIVGEVGSYSDNAIYHLEQAIALSVDGTRDIADEHYDAALKEDLPRTGAIFVRQLKAMNLLQSGAFEVGENSQQSYEEAENVLERAIELADGEEAKVRANLYYLLAKTQSEIAGRATGDDRKTHFTEAVHNARTAVELDPTQGDTYAVLGISLAGLGEYDDARRQCAQAIRMQPNNAEVRWYLGRIYDLQGKYDEAIESLKKAIDLTPKDARLHKAVGAAYGHRAALGGPNHGTNLATALREYEIAIRLNPKDADAYYEDAELLEIAAAEKMEVTVGDTKKVATRDMAMERYEAATALDPKNLNAHLALAKFYQENGKPDEANKHLQAVIDLDPKQVQRYLDVGDYLASAGRKEEALATYQRYLKMDSKNADILYAIGHTARDLGNEKLAVDSLEKALRSKDRHVKANLDLAEIKLGAGKARDAAKLARTALDAAKTDEDKVRAQAVLDASQVKKKQKNAEAPIEPGPTP